MSRQFITFEVGERRLAIEIMAIREIRAWSPVTALPSVPSHIVGVVNLRGVVLPVTDLRQLLGWGATDTTSRHVIIVIQIGGQLRGIIVDAVHDIATLGSEHIQPVPEIGENTASRLLEGIATVDGTLIMVLDLVQLGEPGDMMAEAA
jgi:purine-binding chemotaxis protein CheW